MSLKFLDSCAEVFPDKGGIPFLEYLSKTTGVDPKNIPMDDEKVMSLFAGPEALGISPDQIDHVTIGNLGVPLTDSYSEWRYPEEIRLRPKSISELVRAVNLRNCERLDAGYTQAWADGLDDPALISCKEDILIYLTGKGFEMYDAYKVMEYVGKGQGQKCLEEYSEKMRNAGISDSYFWHIKHIKYLPSVSTGVNEMLTIWHLLYYKLYYPKAFYKGWLKYCCLFSDLPAISSALTGYDQARTLYERSKAGGNLWYIDHALLLMMEMHAREGSDRINGKTSVFKT